MEYRITLKNQLKALDFLIFGSVAYCGVIYFFLKKEEYYHTDIAFNTYMNLFLLLYYLVLLIPTLFLHIEYYLINKNDTVNINAIQKTITFNNQKSFVFNDIEKIILVLTPVLYRKGIIRIMPFDNYHYAIIKMKDSRQFIFTNLMAFRVEEVMKLISGVPIDKKKCFIASPLLSRYWFGFWR
jgi:hypothetical protein